MSKLCQMHCQEAPVSAFHTLAAPSDAAVTTLDMSEENSADTTPLPEGNEEANLCGPHPQKNLDSIPKNLCKSE